MGNNRRSSQIPSATEGIAREPIRVLQILAGAKEYNGVSDVLLSYYQRMNNEKVHFDFLFCRENTMTSRMEESFLRDSHFIVLNAKITGKWRDSKKLIKKLIKAISEQNYDIVHINTGSIHITTCSIIAARRAGVKLIIAHSHTPDPRSIRKYNAIKSIVVPVANEMMRCIIRKESIALFACSNEAGEYLFGRKGLKSEKYKQINNAIDVNNYLYDIKVREKIRSDNGIHNSTTIIGCVGRFSAQKNHRFLIDVFAAYHEIDSDSCLWLVGDGETRAEIELKVRKLGLQENVRFWGQRRDVNQLLQAMDAFVLTSSVEGLGIVSIEAQASGLPVFLPEEISHGSAISNLVQFTSLKESPEVWANKIRTITSKKLIRKDMREVIKAAGYDINEEAGVLEDIYVKLLSIYH